MFNLSPASFLSFFFPPEKLSCHHLITQLSMVKCHLSNTQGAAGILVICNRVIGVSNKHGF